MRWSNALLLWVTVIQATVKCHPMESELQAGLEEGSETRPADSSADTALAEEAVQTPPAGSDDSSAAITSDYLPKTVPTATTLVETESESLGANADTPSPFEPSPYRIEHSLGSLLTSSPPREDSRASTPQTFSSSSPVRGDLPLDLDSEENTDEDIEYYFLGPTQSMLFGPLPVLPNSTAGHQVLEEEEGEGEEEEEGEGEEDSVDISGLQVGDLQASHERKEVIDVGNLLEVDPEFTDLVTDEDISSSSITVTKPPPPPPPVHPPTPSPTTASVSPPNTLASGSLTKSAAASADIHHNKSKNHFNSFVDFANMMPTTELPEVITVFTSSPLHLHDKWTWFFLILRGDCHFVDLKHSYILFYDFVKSLSALLLYNREHIIVDSMTCSGRRMTVNMSIDSLYYPNCEKDLRTLLSHRNLRVDLHNASFYIHSYETKRTLLFETKEAHSEKKDPYVLYVTLGGVGISLVCIFFAGGLFAMYQCLVVRKNRAGQTDLSSRYRAESPRSLCPKYEIDQSMSFSDQRTYSVNMYKSYTDLTAPDLYSHLGSPNHADQEKEKVPNGPTILTKIPKEKNKKNKKKKKKKNNSNTPGIYGLNDCETYQEFWSESITQTNEDFLTVRNLNTMTSSFKTNVKESDSDSLYPLLKKKKKMMAAPMPSPKKPSRVIDDFPLPPPPPHPPPPPPPPPTTCPSSPVISKGVLERMDQLISDTYSNSTPDVTSANGYSRSYSNTTINISSAFPGSSSVPGGASKKNCTTTTTNSSSERAPSVVDQRAPPPSTSASADNLCLTRITFMEMCVWPQHSNPQLSLEGNQSKDHLHLKYP
ncbi:uncharacterized protein [Macrobrachium rosenbergii]|uniref:uncharacterized protein n=1 Tax=Macrobrachium rosenbergii TaxID=79674 RepID=UPI0034D625F0